jgi:hypothetical protein
MKLNGKLVYFLLALLTALLAYNGREIISSVKELSEKIHCMEVRLSIVETKLETFKKSFRWTQLEEAVPLLSDDCFIETLKEPQ